MKKEGSDEGGDDGVGDEEVALGDAEPGICRKGFRTDRADGTGRIGRCELETGHWNQMTESEGLGKGFRVAAGA